MTRLGRTTGLQGVWWDSEGAEMRGQHAEDTYGACLAGAL